MRHHKVVQEASYDDVREAAIGVIGESCQVQQGNSQMLLRTGSQECATWQPVWCLLSACIGCTSRL